MDSSAHPQYQKSPPPQQQEMPGSEAAMHPRPLDEDPEYRPSAKLKDKSVIITGADSGIGRAVAILFAKEGANVSIVYLNEHSDAEYTANRIQELGRKALLPANASILMADRIWPADSRHWRVSHWHPASANRPGTASGSPTPQTVPAGSEKSSRQDYTRGRRPHFGSTRSE
jgi:hypothetical protein